MKKHFYSHLIEIESISVELDTLDLSSEEKKELLELLESSMHQSVLDEILSSLKHEDKKTFLTHLASNNHQEIWKHLVSTVIDVEKKIQSAAQTLVSEFKRDIYELKKHK